MNSDLKKPVDAAGTHPILASDSAQTRPAGAAGFFSATELKQISERLRRDYAPVFRQKKPVVCDPATLSASELLEISTWVSRTHRPALNSAKDLLLLLPVAPGRAYVYWNSPGIKPTAAGPNDCDRSLWLTFYLKAFGQPVADTGTKPMLHLALNHRAGPRQTIAWPENQEQVTCVAVLGQQHPDKPFVVLAQSNVVHLTNPVRLSTQPRPSALLSSGQFSASGQG